jgi:hypothetical protein|eukprot:COSAG01_NODE_232_length_21016_cov_51.558876_6_plen_46_part_00
MGRVDTMGPIHKTLTGEIHCLLYWRVLLDHRHRAQKRVHKTGPQH